MPSPPRYLPAPAESFTSPNSSFTFVGFPTFQKEFSNVKVVCGRAEDQAVEQFGVAVAKALAPPPVAAEWCLPLVVVGGAVILLVGSSADVGAVARVSAQLGGGEPEEHPGLLVVPKLAPTPVGFPRRPGVARKRPLA